MKYWSLHRINVMTSSSGYIFRVTGLCAGNSPVTGEFPAQWPVTRSFDVFCDLRQNKRLNKLSWGWWFEMASRSLWSHRSVMLPAASYTWMVILTHCLDSWLMEIPMIWQAIIWTNEPMKTKSWLNICSMTWKLQPRKVLLKFWSFV